MAELTLRELQLASLDILKDVHAFCVANDIRYSMAYGTLIGAVRHKGFIPWDDDMDIVMPRPDFEKFCKSYKSGKYRLIYYGNDKTALACFGRVVDCKRTRFAAERPWTAEKSGVWLDIMPLDGVEENLSIFSRRYHLLRFFRYFPYKFRRQNHHIVRGDSLWSVLKTIIAKVLGLNGVLPAWMIKSMVSSIKRIPYGSSRYVCQCSVLDDEAATAYPIEDFNNYILMDFEDTQFYAAEGYDRFLRLDFGDYMLLPPPENRRPKQYWIKFYRVSE